ncbi:mitochondrial cytochrome c oxidase subunit VIa [Tilletiopsis washingtonensis]|uniref:Mitochondrial cytochrome c oxidase subunit VIa n=1 Tax=Tilletiopsis washingtonensis TaxID=58919 RepID=A0A316ZFG9_9BASI|nr:mitochondrial cytochrome c oxidase subunit VIa [Tilletiopsis washingtonensis]PWO00491.1 mitochondrial cytochrome c oxidase subunit VIa [Tilletiopsis washingtonensis]
MSLRAALRPATRALRVPAAAPQHARFASSDALGQELLAERKHAVEHAAGSADLWRKISMYVCLPGSIVLGVYIYQIEAAHIAHRDHELHENDGKVDPGPRYEYRDRRVKPFAWGNNSFFFNPKANTNMDELE